MSPTNPNGYEYGEEGLCVCADCHTISPQNVDLDFGTFWADCPTCETITGVALDSNDLPNGRDYDHQFHLRHFAESYTPTLVEVVSCLLEELDQEPQKSICENCKADAGECPSWCLFEQGVIDCPHEDYSQTLTGAVCNDCGLEHEEE